MREILYKTSLKESALPIEKMEPSNMKEISMKENLMAKESASMTVVKMNFGKEYGNRVNLRKK